MKELLELLDSFLVNTMRRSKAIACILYCFSTFISTSVSSNLLIVLQQEYLELYEGERDKEIGRKGKRGRVGQDSSCHERVSGCEHRGEATH